MDQVTVDVGDHEVRPGDIATFFGPAAPNAPTIEECAQAAGTISYEIMTRLGARAVREYIGE